MLGIFLLKSDFGILIGEMMKNLHDLMVIIANKLRFFYGGKEISLNTWMRGFIIILCALLLYDMILSKKPAGIISFAEGRSDHSI